MVESSAGAPRLIDMLHRRRMAQADIPSTSNAGYPPAATSAFEGAKRMLHQSGASGAHACIPHPRTQRGLPITRRGGASWCASICLAMTLVIPANASAFGVDKANRIASKIGSDIKTMPISPVGHSSLHGTRAIAVIDAPIDRVREIVLDYGQYKRFIPHITESKVDSRRGSDALVRLNARVLHGTIGDRWATVKIVRKPNQDATEVVSGSMVKGNIKDFRAKWYLTEVAAKDNAKKAVRTLVTFEMLVDPGLPSMLDGAIEGQLEKIARHTLSRLRSHLKRHGA